jgi:hypothetical protein
MERELPNQIKQEVKSQFTAGRVSKGFILWDLVMRWDISG